MLLLITRHQKVFFEKYILSNIEHGGMTSKIPFLSLLPWERMSRYIFFFINARPIPLLTKVHFTNLQFLAVTYDMGVLSFAPDVV